MKQKQEVNSNYFFPIRTIITVTVIMAVVTLLTSAIKDKRDVSITNAVSASINNDGPIPEAVKDSVASVKAFMEVYKVLMSPRCMNCHPSGDVPLQGEDSHLHTMLPKRGKEGKGLYAMKCSNCHQPTNIAGLNKPPGHPNWHLPPANMKMVFQGRTPYELAKQLMNPKTNGNKTVAQLIAHADDGLVKAGWNMGEGRALPPLSHEEFKKAWITWITMGAYAPKWEPAPQTKSRN